MNNNRFTLGSNIKSENTNHPQKYKKHDKNATKREANARKKPHDLAPRR